MGIEYKNKRIVVFDGSCIMCNSVIDFLFKIDKQNKLLFTHLEGEKTTNFLSLDELKKFDSLIFYNSGLIYYKSDAVCEIFKYLGGVYKILYLVKFIPKKIRDLVYDVIAKNRLRWFGVKKECRLLSAEERLKFIY